jgi:WD40 repeat protein
MTVALHPLGYFLAIGFADKFRVFHILMNELQLFREFSIRGVRVLKFSHGGHFLAAGNGKLVLIFASSTLRRIATLRGHSSLVQGVAFDANDTTLATCGADGVVYEWSTTTWARIRDVSQRNTELSCVSYDSARRIVAAGNQSEGQSTFLSELDAVDLQMHAHNTSSAASQSKNIDLHQETIHTLYHPQGDGSIMYIFYDSINQSINQWHVRNKQTRRSHKR